MPTSTEQAPDGHAMLGGWVTIHVKVPEAWRDELRQAALERATTMSDLVRAAVRQVMIGRPR